MMGCGDGDPVPQNSTLSAQNGTVYRLWVRTLTAPCWWDGRADSTDSLMEKPKRIRSQVLRGSSRHEDCSAIATAVFGLRLGSKAWCTYTRERQMRLRNLPAYRGMTSSLSLKIAKGISGSLRSMDSIGFAFWPSPRLR